MSDTDKQFEKNLAAIIKGVKLPPQPDDEKTMQWAAALKPTEAAKQKNFFSRRKLIEISSVAAILLICITALSLLFSPDNLTADEIFRQLDETITASPAVEIRIKNIACLGQLWNGEYYASQQGEDFFLRCRTQTMKQKGWPVASMDFEAAHSPQSTWMLVREFSCDGWQPLEKVIAKNAGLLVHWQVGKSATGIPHSFEISNLAGFIASLRSATSDLKIIRNSKQHTILEAVITKPDKLNAACFLRQISVLENDEKKSPGIIGGMENLDSFSEMIVKVIVNKYREYGLSPQQENEIAKSIFAQMQNATMKIDIDAESKTIISISLENVGQFGGSLMINFQPSQNQWQNLIDIKRFTGMPNLKILTKQQLLRNMND